MNLIDGGIIYIHVDVMYNLNMFRVVGGRRIKNSLIR